MRLLLATVATLAAVAFAAPSFAQSDPAAAPAPAPTPAAKAKPAQGTAAYCKTLKSGNSRSACLKRVQASAPKAAPTTTTAAKKKAKKLDAPKSDNSASAAPMTTGTPATATLPPQTVAIPPLPQKTI